MTQNRKCRSGGKFEGGYKKFTRKEKKEGNVNHSMSYTIYRTVNKYRNFSGLHDGGQTAEREIKPVLTVYGGQRLMLKVSLFLSVAPYHVFETRSLTN